jgi:hypothetical protein
MKHHRQQILLENSRATKPTNSKAQVSTHKARRLILAPGKGDRQEIVVVIDKGQRTQQEIIP